MNKLAPSTIAINPARSSLMSLDSSSSVSGIIELTTMPRYSETVSAFLPEFDRPQQIESMVIAQHFDQDILGDLGDAMSQFVESGQVWALLIGIVLGYLIRGLTTY